MRAVLLEVPDHLLEERRRTGADRLDEMWDGVLHMVPPPGGRHQRFGSGFLAVLLPRAVARGLLASYETGVGRPGATLHDYRVPDLAVYKPEHASDFGIDGRAEMLVEIRSPYDESYEKLPYYAEMAVQELLIVEPVPCTVELFRLRHGRLEPVVPGEDGAVRSAVLDVSFRTVDGPALLVEWDGGSARVTGDATTPPPVGYRRER